MSVPITSSSTAYYTHPKGPGATLTSSPVGLISLTETDLFYAPSTLWSQKSLDQASFGDVVSTVSHGYAVDSTSSLPNWTNAFSSSPSAYAYFAATLLKKYGFIGTEKNPITGSHTAFLNSFRNASVGQSWTTVSLDNRIALGKLGLVAIKKIGYGESIRPLSWSMTGNGSGVTYYDSVSASNEWGYVHSSLDDNQRVGLIFYEDGVVLILNEDLAAGDFQACASGDSNVFSGMQFQSTYKIWQLNAFCTTPADQLNYSSNDSAFYAKSVTSTEDSLSAFDTYGYQWGDGGLNQSETRGNFYKRGMFYDVDPFVTTVALHNDQNDIVAVAKLSQPIRKSKQFPLTIRVALDFD